MLNTQASTQLTLLTEYLKDLSFESPQASRFTAASGRPAELQVGVDVKVNQQSEVTYEVTLDIEIHATSDATVVYHVELVYGGLFRVDRCPKELLQAALFGACPKILFPTLRRVLADVTRDAGFAPLMLDFGRLYGRAKPRR